MTPTGRAVAVRPSSPHCPANFFESVMTKLKKNLATSVILERELKEELRKEGKKQDLSVSQLIRRILKSWLDFQRGNKGDLST